ncbi:polymeric immunoglobulin receptor-like isoform X2 [Brachyhypopomus gauderio]|uniref:polymeric immunoglobulin receptor-like isoform X2 n=1 Tax=Brachyhypopomus gauderio TaxID=698409 RepID=UPI004041FAEA
MQYLLIVIFFVQGIERTWTEKKLTLQTGGSVTIPCHYDRGFIQHKKYWCYHDKAAFNYCSILAYANTTEGKVTVTDNPAQSLFTVTMRDLEEDHTGTYWCAVEIEGIFQLDVTEQLYFTVTSAPAVSVNRNSVSGEEGSSVSVQCLYSAAYQNKHKQWCRSTDWSCYTVGRTYTSQNSTVWISDDGKTFFKVEMSGLKKSDAGWYWCSVGDVQVPVHLTVTEDTGHRTVVVLTVFAGLTLLAGVAFWMWRRKRGSRQSESQKRNTEWEQHNAELSYSSVIFKESKKKLGQRDTEAQTSLQSEEPVTYSTLTNVKQSP